MRKLTFSMVICLSVLFLGTTAMAQRTASLSGNWSNTATWGGYAVPTSADAVIINDDINVTVNVAAVCASLTIKDGTRTHEVTISGSNSLTVSGAVTIDKPTANNRTKTIAVGSGTLSCTSIVMASPYNETRICQVTVSTGTITVSGDITMNGLDAKNQIVFTDAGTLYIAGNMTSGSTLKTVAGSTVNYNNDGKQTIGGYVYTNLTLSGSGTKTTTGATVNEILSMQGTATTTGTVATYGAAATLEYKGFNAQTTGTEFPATWSGSGGVIIDNASGVTLDADRTISSTLTMTSGNITTGTYILTLGTSTSVLGTLSYSSGNIIGTFKRWFANATVSNVYFPVGTSSTINMVTLSFTGAPSAGGSLTAKFIASDPGTNGTTYITDDAGSYIIDTYSQRGYWQIDAGDGLTGGTYDLSLRSQGFNPLGNEITNYAHLRIIKRINAGNNWILDGTHLDATGSNNDPIMQRNGLSSGFSQFAMGGNVADGNPLEGPLPVELASFSANVISRDVKLNWTTASELNNAGFEIQKSVVSSQKSGDWTKVGYITGNGTKTTPTNYSFEDKKLNTGKYNYRLKQIDYNGNFEYHNLASIIEVGVPNKFDISQNYPNPFNPTSKIDFDLPFDSKVSLKLYDMSGRELLTIVNEQKTAGYYTVQMIGNNLSSGMYFYRIIAEGNGQKYVMTKKAMLIK
jgi:hypothetical protein